MRVRIQDYKEAASAFSRGELSFEELLALVARLPPPPTEENEPVHDESLNDLYIRVERQYSTMPQPHSLSWLATLHNFGDITREQYDALLRTVGQATRRELAAAVCDALAVLSATANTDWESIGDLEWLRERLRQYLAEFTEVDRLDAR